MEISSITAALSGIKAATDIARVIKDSGASLEAAEVKFKLADLIVALADAKLEIANFKELLSRKDDEINELKKSLSIEQSISWEDPYYYSISESGEKNGPFCQRCFDVDKKLIRLQSYKKDGFWQCNECSNDYCDSSYQSHRINNRR